MQSEDVKFNIGKWGETVYFNICLCSSLFESILMGNK